MKRYLFKVFSAFAVLALMLAALPMQSAQALGGGSGSISLTTLGSAYTQNFDILANTGTTNNLTVNGWYLDETGSSTRNNGQYAAGGGSDNTGDTYSFGALYDTERAFGGLLSSTLNPTIGAQFTNNTGATITSLDISYIGEMWRAGVANRGAADRLDFQLSTTATSLTTGSWVDYNSLDYNSSNINTTLGAVRGNAPGNQTAISFSITDLSIPNGASFWIRWLDFNISNSDDGLAVDDFSLTAQGIVAISDPKINEFSASTTGTDVEYVEIFGTPNTDYSAYNALEIEGDGADAGKVDEVLSLGTTDANGFYLANLPANALENGTLSLLLVKNFTGALNNDLDTNNDGIFDVTPWDALVDSVAVNDGGAGDVTYGVPTLGVAYDGLPYAPGGASRIPDGFDTDAATDWVRNDFDLAGIPGYAGTPIVGEAYNTPGATNEIYVPPPEACGDPFTPIYNVQGNGLASPLVSTEVAIQGVVVGDFQNNASPDDGELNGFHVQDPLGDSDATTSDGIFVYAPGGMDVSAGDEVRVRGSVSEYNGMTEITASQIWVCSSGNTVAATEISLPVTSPDAFEAFEGMLVTFPQALYISEYFNFDRYGEMVLTSERHMTPTAEFEPGAPSIQAAQEFLLDKITLDDGRTNQNPDPAIHPNGGIFDLTNLFRGGDTVTNVTGLMDYSFGLYRIQPIQGADYTPANPRTAQPEDVGGNLKVASFNVLNYFTTLNSRGANTPEEFERQRNKIIAALSIIDADVVGLMEIENNTDAITDLVAGLNDANGAGTYAYVDTGVIGTDEIKVAFIYKPASVTLIGNYAILDSSVDPRFIDTRNRPALAQTFVDSETGGIFTVVVNHLKSKGSECEGDPDLGDGAGNCNITRTLAAQALVDWLSTDPTGSGDDDFLIIGDLNSYDKEDPIDAIKAGPDDILGTDDDYTDMVFQFQGEYAYSYVFDGQLGYLDHALASAGLVGDITGVTDWHINADEPDLIDYDMTFKADAQDALYAQDPYRSSDHDPVIIGLNVCDEIAPAFEDVTVSPDTLWPANHKYVNVNATVTVSDNFDPSPVVELVSITSSEPDNGLGDGDFPNDIVIVDDFNFKLRAERSGTNGEGRTYTITYRVTDACGNFAEQSVTVFVPFSQKKK